jgi:hypothetical protein
MRWLYLRMPQARTAGESMSQHIQGAVLNRSISTGHLCQLTLEKTALNKLEHL